MNKPLLLIAGLLLLLIILLPAACYSPAYFIQATATPEMLPSVSTKTPASARETPPIEMIGVLMHLDGDARTAPEVEAGSTITIVLNFNPSRVAIERDENGVIHSSSWKPWENHPAVMLRACFSASAPCTPEGDWQPYTPSLEYSVWVDWSGPRDVHAAVEFRDNHGSAILAGNPSTAQVEERYAVFLTIISRANPQTPVETLSPAIQTAQAATQLAFPVTGSVLIEDGRCCAGGKAGDEIKLRVSFEATSPTGMVTEMRVQTAGGCQKDQPMLEADWEPFVFSKTYAATLALNWVGFYVNVQYRDSGGQLSPVYCDDISLEGSP